jgi:hypothetical protein
MQGQSASFREATGREFRSVLDFNDLAARNRSDVARCRPILHGEGKMGSLNAAAPTYAILDDGGTIAHHHAVGQHRPGYDRQRFDLSANVLAAARQTLDSAGILNPGVLIDAPWR